MLWLLQAAPGLPDYDTPLAVGDLGAGTCAASLGAWLALREHAGEEQPFRVYPADVASSGERFVNAFRAMTKRAVAAHGHQPLLPMQDAGQYRAVSAAGIEELARALLLDADTSPHLVIASFSLHYLARDKRAPFFSLLATLATRPFLLLVIKGVGDHARPPRSHVHTVFFGVHYVIGRDDRQPRVVEAHLCLILPTGYAAAPAEATPEAEPEPEAEPKPEAEATLEAEATSAAEATTRSGPQQAGPSEETDPPLPPLPDARLVPRSDRWVLRTFEAVERRCQRDGLRTGVTLLD